MLTIQKVITTHSPGPSRNCLQPRYARRTAWVCLGPFAIALTALWAATTPAAKLPASPVSTSEKVLIAEALGWMGHTPGELLQFDYDMTVRVRLLFFWVAKDDVGGGYIRRGISKEDPRLELFQVLFGSDPAKAPKQINRWGAGSEAEWHSDPVSLVSPTAPGSVTASAFFGFMKSSKGKSVSEMQAELKKEKDQGEHAFTGILSRDDPGHAFSLIVPLNSNEDYTLHQYEAAEPLMIDKLNTSERPARTLTDSALCNRSGEFLGTVAELMDAALKNAATPGGATGNGSPQPASLCYVHDAQVNTLTLEHTEPVKKLQAKINAAKGGILADNTFDNLLQLDFVSTHQLTGKKVYFTLLVGTQGSLRGVPVQIRYEPNWWFQVVLNLQPNSSRLQLPGK